VSKTFTNASATTANKPEDAVKISGDDLISLLEILRRDGFPIGIKEYIAAQEILIACSSKDGIEPVRLRNWLAPVLCINPDEQRFFYQRFAEWMQQRLPPIPIAKIKPTPHKTQLDKDIKKARPWKWLVIAISLMAAVVAIPQLPERQEDIVITPPTTKEPGSEQPLSTRPNKPGQADPIKQEPLEPQMLISGRVHSLEGQEVYGATVTVARKFKGHDARVRSLSFSPDGRRMVTLSNDKTARILNTGDGRELASMPHDASLYFATFSPDGGRVVTVSEDKTARIWDAGDGRELASLPHDDTVYSAVFSPDGSHVVTESMGTARIWDTDDGRELERLPHDGIGAVTAAAFSPDGSRVVTASWDESARIWDAGDSRELVRLSHEGIVYSAVFSSDGKRVVTASEDKTVRIWNVDDGRELMSLTHDDAVYSATFSPDGRRLVTVSLDKIARIWGAGDGRELVRLPHDDRVHSAVFSSDGKRVVTASEDKTVRLWDADNGRELARLPHDDVVYSAEFSPDGKLLATNSYSSAKLLSWVGNDTTGNFNLASNLANNTQLQISHPDYQTTTLHDIPEGFGQLTIEARLAPRPALWLDTFIHNPIQTRIILALLPLLAVTAWWLWRRKRRQLILERRSVRNVDTLAGVTIPEPQHKLYSDKFFVRARIEARRHQASGQGDLDADATVDETVRQLGWFSPVYKARLSLPAYLALIDRNGFQDQQSRLIDEFLDRLENGGVEIDRYYFDRDPRMCTSGGRGNKTRRTLRELAGRYAQQRLLLFSDGSGLLNPVTGRPSPWTEQFSAWPERALMTPVPTFHWASREVELARLGCRVLPATPAGLLAFVEQLGDSKNISPLPSTQWCEQFPEIITAQPARWLQRDEPNTEDIDTLLAQLKRYLGGDSYRWLCALSVYPELDWYLTLYLGLHLKDKDGKSVLDETTLLRLLRLPWLRRGNIPDWLRLRLIEELNSNDEDTVRGFLRELMRDQLEAPSSRFHLDIAHPSESIYKRDWTRFFTDMLRTEPEDSPLQDRVFVNFLLGKRPQRLQVLAPRSWHRLVYEQGLSALGLRERAGFLLAACASVLLGLSTISLIQFAEGLQAGDTPSQIIEQDWQPAKSGSQTQSQIAHKFEPATKIADPTAFPPDYTAVYSMVKNDLNIGEYKVTLSRQKNETWLYQSQSKSEGILSLINNTIIKEETTLAKIQGHIKPQTYKYANTEIKINAHLIFKWKTNSIGFVVEEKRGSRRANENRGSLRITDETIDNLSLYLRLMSDLKVGQTFLSYNVVKNAKILNYRFEILGEENIETDAGNYNTLKLKGSIKESKRSMMIWLAPELHFLPVKILSSEQSEDTFDGPLTSADLSLTRVTGAITDKASKPVAQQAPKENTQQQPVLKDVFTEKGRFSVRKLNLNKNGRYLEMQKGGQINATLQINHDCPDCGGAINQIIVGLAGEERAQACIWNGGRTSRGWQTVKFKLNIPNTPGKYEIRTRYAQAYNCKDALGWWKVDRPTGPGVKSTIGYVSVKQGEAKPTKPVEADTNQPDKEQQNIKPQAPDLMNPKKISTLDKKWNTEVWTFYNKNIKGRYPFNLTSKTSVSLENFGEFFGEGGIVHQFTENELEPYLDTSSNPWRWKDYARLGNPGFTTITLRQLERASEIRKAFFMGGGKTPQVSLRLKPYRLDSKVARFILQYDDKRYTYSHGPKFWKDFQWTGTNQKHRARYMFEDLNGKITQVDEPVHGHG